MTERSAPAASQRTGRDTHLDPAAPAFLTIDLDALTANYRALQAQAPGAECAAVVKADAYGTGALQAVAALCAAGCRIFFVATLGEARQIRSAAAEADLYVLDGLFPDAAPGFAEIGARPVLGSLPEIAEWAAFCRETGAEGPAAIHIDTGMNRLGLREAEVDALAADSDLLAAFTPVLVMSHLACADESDHPMNETQRLAFDALRAKLPAIPTSLANSAGIFLGPSYRYDMVRPGIALYGARAVSGVPNPMMPVVRLLARIVQIRDANAGETVGYGATRHLTRATRIATIAAGYADGIFRHLGAGDGESGITAHIDGHTAPVLGRVSMDTLTLDVTDVPEKLARRGAFVELLGDRVSVDDLADRAGTIGYEILTSLGRRYQRLYRGAGHGR